MSSGEGGLFSVKLGSGQIADGSGPGVYLSLVDVFRDFSPVYMEVEIAGEVLSPRLEVVSAASALNASRLGGLEAASFLDNSTTAQQKNGDLTLTGDVQVDGALTLTSGGPGAGRVLTSDGAGASVSRCCSDSSPEATFWNRLR